MLALGGKEQRAIRIKFVTNMFPLVTGGREGVREMRTGGSSQSIFENELH